MLQVFLSSFEEEIFFIILTGLFCRELFFSPPSSSISEVFGKRIHFPFVFWKSMFYRLESAAWGIKPLMDFKIYKPNVGCWATSLNSLLKRKKKEKNKITRLWKPPVSSSARHWCRKCSSLRSLTLLLECC